MYTMLYSHVQHTVDQLAYIQGQITSLSLQIDDLSVEQGSDSESDQFKPFWPFQSKRGRKFLGGVCTFDGE